VGTWNQVLDEVTILHGTGQFFGLSGPLKNIGSLCCGTSKRDMVIQSSITVWLFVKILWPLVAIGIQIRETIR